MLSGAVTSVQHMHFLAHLFFLFNKHFFHEDSFVLGSMIGTTIGRKSSQIHLLPSQRCCDDAKKQINKLDKSELSICNFNPIIRGEGKRHQTQKAN